MSTMTTDLAIIGSGGAAMAAAIQARSAGASALVIERGTVGGTCVNVGCVPSKILLAAATARHGALTNPFQGVPTVAGPVDLAALVSQKDDLVDDLRRTKYADVADAHGFGIMHGRATFTGPDSLDVDGRPLVAGAFVVATGATPSIPRLDGIADVDVLTSTTAMELTKLPDSLVVVGGGFVGLEQAQLFAHLGVPVTLVGRLAPHAEPELAARLRGVFSDDAITVVEEPAVAIARRGRGVVVTTTSGRIVTGERLLVATGRTARTDGLGLDAAGVATDARGFVVTDERLRTTSPRVWAAGDVTGAPQFVYAAASAGRVSAANALGDHQRVDWTGLPSVTFTRPQLASAGLTERQALERGFRPESRLLDLTEVPRALVNRDTRGAVKIVADAGTGRVLGVHALADGAGEMMLAATYAITADFTIDRLADTWAPYLTMAEAIRLTARLFRTEMPASCCA